MKLNALGVAAISATLLSFGTISSTAQSNDALLEKLVSKGVLTKQEADELKKESASGYDRSFRAKTGLPDYVTSLRIYGDFRGRFDGIYTDNDTAGAPNHDRTRMRYRLRVGAIATLKDSLELGFRLTSGDPQSNFGGDPISGNSTLQDNGSKKFLWVDQAYGKWTPINHDAWKLSGTVGKMENPFVLSSLVFDEDYTPEGFGVGSTYTLNQQHALKFAGGFFLLDEISQGQQSDQDPFMMGVQARWDAKWAPAWESSMGAAFLAITDERSLTNFSVPNLNIGNTRAADGTLVHNYTPLVLDAAVTYSFASMPGYNGKFPVRMAGTFVNNFGPSRNNTGYEVGATAGKSGKKGTWELGYRWRYLDRDAWYEEVVDSDYGAFYQTAFANSATGSGYRAGTNVKGHIFRASYSPADAFTLTLTYVLSELIDPSVVNGQETESQTGRLLIDAMWRF